MLIPVYCNHCYHIIVYCNNHEFKLTRLEARQVFLYTENCHDDKTRDNMAQIQIFSLQKNLRKEIDQSRNFWRCLIYMKIKKVDK